MLVSDDHSENCHMTRVWHSGQWRVTTNCHMTGVVMVRLPFPVKGTMPIQYCLTNTVIWLRTQEMYIHREILYIRRSIPYLFAYVHTIIQTVGHMHMLCYHFRDETEEGGEVSHILNNRNRYCKDCNTLCSKVTACLSKHLEIEKSLNVVEQLFLQILHTTLGCCHSRPPGQSNTWAEVKCFIFTFFS